MSKLWVTWPAGTAYLLMGLFVSQTYAEEYEKILEEIFVTAQKREQNLQDVGIAITAFTSERLKDLGLTKNLDVSAQTPGLLFVEGDEQLISITNIRGVSQNDVTFHLEPPNSVYMDHAYISILSAANFQIFDLERVEILKGPQGTLSPTMARISR